MKRRGLKSQKKSETLEVRISYDTKQKLTGRAVSEDRTVSDVVRSLIDTYLANQASDIEPSIFGDAVMRLKKLFIHKPKTVLTSLMAMTASLFLFIPTATAEPIMLNVQGEYVEYEIEGPNSTRTRRFETEIELDFGSTIVISVDGKTVSDNPILTEDGIWLKVEVDEVDTSQGKKAVGILLSIIDKNNETETVVAQPNLTAPYDETASFISQTEEKSYSFKFSPRSKP